MVAAARRARLATLVAAAFFVVGCDRENVGMARLERRSEWPMPDAEERAPCADVGDLRVCWRDAGTSGAHVVSRRAPPFALSSLGFRSVGSGEQKRVVDRSRSAPPFHCAGDLCRQESPRLPDAGEWECADFASVVVCHGGLSPAGVPPGGADPGYTCGARARTPASGGGEGATSERVCVDLSPDMPEGVAHGYRCRFVVDGGLARSCRKDTAAQSVADPCLAAGDCAAGLLCLSGHCLPRLPSPACWLDRDCDNGTCRFGSCLPGAS